VRSLSGFASDGVWVTKLSKQVALLQKAAANRVSRLAESDASLKELVDAGVVHKLLAMLKPEVDEGTWSSRQGSKPLLIPSYTGQTKHTGAICCGLDPKGFFVLHIYQQTMHACISQSCHATG